jgi:TPR repeat protein
MRLPTRFIHLSVLSLLTAAAAAAAERPWLEVKSPHFTVVTNGTEGDGREVAWQFEQMRTALQKLWPWAKLSTDKPVLVLAGRDEATLKALVPEYWEKGREPIASIHSEGRDRHYLAMRTDTRMTDDVRMTPYFNLYRGYLQVVLSSSFERPLPLWLLRGIPELFGNLRVREKDVFLGRMVPWHVDRLRKMQLLPLQTLLSADRASPYFQEGDRRRVFDAESWAFLHYLLFADEGKHGAQLNRLLSLMAQGTSLDAARREAFPDLAGLEKGLSSYLHSAGIPFSRIDVDVDIARERFPVRALSPAESAAVRASFHVTMDRPNEARALIQEAKAADPAAAGAYDAEGLLAELERKDDAARAAFARAAELGSTNFYTWYENARLAHHGGRDADTLARMEKSLQRSVELNPDYASGYSYLAETKLSLGKKDEALSLARRAVSLEPGGSYHHGSLASALVEQSKSAEAVAEAERAVELAREDWERDNARKVLDYVKRRASPDAGASQGTGSATVMEACLGGGDAAACAKLAVDLDRACAAGEGRACTALGWIHESGKGVAVDLARAAALYKKGCEKEDKSGCARFAWLQARGEGVAKDEAGGMAALDRLCAEGFFEACTQLAVLHAGRKSKEGMARAKELLKKACDGGDTEACRLLSSMPR